VAVTRVVAEVTRGVELLYRGILDDPRLFGLLIGSAVASIMSFVELVAEEFKS
jgi:hypothetical protein